MEGEGTKAEVAGVSIFKSLAGRKALKSSCEKDLVNSASETTGTNVELKRKLKRKRPYEDPVENPSFASVEAKMKHLYPSFASTTTVMYGSRKAGLKIKIDDSACPPPASYPSEYALIDYPDANVYSAGIPYELYLEGRSVVAKISGEVYKRKPRVISNTASYSATSKRTVSSKTIFTEKPILSPKMEAYVARLKNRS